VLMPSPYSSDHSVSDALALARNLGIQTQTIPIQPMMQGFDTALAPMFAGTDFGVAEENLQSRIRGNLLMAIANKFGYLLLSTGNKSEMSVGYCTLYGDMNGGVAAIADVPKTKVYELCRWLNDEAQWQQENAFDVSALSRASLPFSHAPIPSHIITKPPSAELRPDQVDQDSLPPYEVLDDILERLIELHQSIPEIVAAGFDPTTVDRVAHLVKIAEFKRRQAPPGLKITDRAFGTGWRMPIAQQWRPQATDRVGIPV
jgi:NAD+ synthase (glutamine-hydrolysing)